jgi:hypothetical protein
MQRVRQSYEAAMLRDDCTQGSGFSGKMLQKKKNTELKPNIRNNICHCDFGKFFCRGLLLVKKENKQRKRK